MKREVLLIMFVLLRGNLALAEPLASTIEHDTVAGMDMVWIPTGCFEMGQTEAEKRALLRLMDESRYQNWYSYEIPQHHVCLDDFWMGRTEVTQAQWQRIMGNNPSKFKGENFPVETVSWNDAQAFLNKLNQKAGKTIYRLPTEAEWEYACRAGRQTIYFFGNDAKQLEKYACACTWYGSRADGKTEPVGQKQPNSWGLYDMHGNVWEWISDWHGPYPATPQKNPRGPAEGSNRVIRGGSWGNDPQDLRSAVRSNSAPSYKSSHIGFRLVRITAP